MLDDSRVRNSAPYREQVSQVVTLVRRLHPVPLNWRPTPLVPVRSQRQSGALFFGPGPNAYVAIEFRESGNEQAVSILHEVGHLLDYQVIGSPGVWATGPPLDASLIQWEQAVKESTYWQLLDRVRSQPKSVTKYGDIDSGDLTFLDYFLSPRELFARSYAQWAVERSGDEQLQAPLLGLVAPSHPTDEFPERWEADDFRAIATALDDLF